MEVFNPFQFAYDFGVGFLQFMQKLWDTMTFELFIFQNHSITLFGILTFTLAGVLVALFVWRLATSIVGLSK